MLFMPSVHPAKMSEDCNFLVTNVNLPRFSLMKRRRMASFRPYSANACQSYKQHRHREFML